MHVFCPPSLYFLLKGVWGGRSVPLPAQWCLYCRIWTDSKGPEGLRNRAHCCAGVWWEPFPSGAASLGLQCPVLRAFHSRTWVEPKDSQISCLPGVTRTALSATPAELQTWIEDGPLAFFRWDLTCSGTISIPHIYFSAAPTFSNYLNLKSVKMYFFLLSPLDNFCLLPPVVWVHSLFPPQIQESKSACNSPISSYRSTLCLCVLLIHSTNDYFSL